jgi:hypothetical protein
MRRNIIAVLFLVLVLLTPSTLLAREITLFDSDGEAVAYIDTADELNIYLWEGKPVAYLDEQSIYGFNGKHLGWFKGGIIWDHKGFAVGFVEGAVNKLTKLEPLKGLQELTPLKSLQELEHLNHCIKINGQEYHLKFFYLWGVGGQETTYVRQTNSS